ncbi:MAG TPA: ATP-binding protein [Candidatus Limnocylindria bacterium]|nr:ATP-binding protein [Candidatus Limnocylindria bacterium]
MAPAPARAQDEERPRLRRALRQELVVRLSVGALLLLFNEVFTVAPHAQGIIRVTALVALALNLPYVLAAQTGVAPRAQAYVRMCLDVLFITAGLYAAGGIAAAQYLTLYTIVAVYTGMMFSGRACLVATAVATVSFVTLAVLQTEGVLPLHRPLMPGAWEIVAFNLLVLNIVGGMAALLSEAYRQSRQRLHVLNAELERAHDEAQRLAGHIQQAARLSMLGDVVGGVTHEVRNVLQSVFGQLWMVRRKLRDAPAEVTEHLDEIEASCEGAMRIIRTTLDMARHPAAATEPVRLAGVVERVAQLKAYDLRRDRIALSLEFEPGMPAVSAAAFQLQQVLLNLVSNAQDELREVGGRRDLVIAGFVEGHHCVMEVRDNGRGIPSRALARIFEPFFTTKPTGTGLGLPISAGIVEGLGGRLTAGNRSSGGAVFRITLPAAGASGVTESAPSAS